MLSRPVKNQNSLNIFLGNYFSVFIVAAVILVLAFSYFFFIRPKFNQTLLAIKDNIEQQQKLFTDQQKKLASLKAIADLYKKIDPADLQKFNSVLSNEYLKESLFGELEEIVTANGFVLKSVKLSQSQTEKEGADSPSEQAPTFAAGQKLSPRLGTIEVELLVNSIDYNGFKNLTKTLENNLRLFDVSKINFSPSTASAGFTLTTYYYKKSTK